jgi:hypothetical protein
VLVHNTQVSKRSQTCLQPLRRVLSRPARHTCPFCRRADRLGPRLARWHHERVHVAIPRGDESGCTSPPVSLLFTQWCSADISAIRCSGASSAASMAFTSSRWTRTSTCSAKRLAATTTGSTSALATLAVRFCSSRCRTARLCSSLHPSRPFHALIVVSLCRVHLADRLDYTLNVEGGSPANGTKPIMWLGGKSNNDRWRIRAHNQV